MKLMHVNQTQHRLLGYAAMCSNSCSRQQQALHDTTALQRRHAFRPGGQLLQVAGILSYTTAGAAATAIVGCITYPQQALVLLLKPRNAALLS
jgi:hypothetical protein